MRATASRYLNHFIPTFGLRSDHSEMIVQTGPDDVDRCVRRGSNRSANVNGVVHDEGVITEVEVEIFNLAVHFGMNGLSTPITAKQ